MRGFVCGIKALGGAIAVASAFIAGVAWADDSWTPVSESSAGTVHSVRTKDIINATNNPTVWVKGDASRNKTVPYRISMSQYQIDCVNKTSATKARIVYGPDMALLYSETYPHARSGPIAPDTVMEEIARNVCQDYAD